ncbi:hypothetical protein, partial [Mesorhizobium sp.]|uniref:hypothetical protein n=1 Tax=Mesorhizobium sp. TaxID=1871066 RepID=UPI0025C4DDF0
MLQQWPDEALVFAGVEVELNGLGKGEAVLWVEVDLFLGTQLAIQADLVRFGFVSFASALVYALLAFL